LNFPEFKIGDLILPTPVIQGGMGVGISLSSLASAVANEGGIGVISAAMPGIGEPDIGQNGDQANIRFLQNEIRKAKLLTKGVLGVNIMVALTNFSDMVRTSIEEEIDIIFAGAGLPLGLPGYLTEGSKTKLVPIVSSGRAATLLCKKWLLKHDYLPDGFVVEGPMAGGHLGFKASQLDDPNFSLENLVKDTIEAVKPFEEERKAKIPIIAAGGIFTGQDIRKFLNLGAAAVQLGTRFVATDECDAEAGFKQTYIEASEEDLVVIKSPLGLPGRVIRNRFIEQINEGKKTPINCPYHCLKTCDPEKSPYCIAIALNNARKGKFSYGFAFAGSNAFRVTEIIPVKQLMETLQTEFSLAS
jgi:nitronate monooxygenase